MSDWEKVYIDQVYIGMGEEVSFAGCPYCFNEFMALGGDQLLGEIVGEWIRHLENCTKGDRAGKYDI